MHLSLLSPKRKGDRVVSDGQMPEGMNGLHDAFMQSVMNNPELVQSFMRNNPAFQQVCDQSVTNYGVLMVWMGFLVIGSES